MRGESEGRAEKSEVGGKEKAFIAAGQHKLADEMMFQIEASVHVCVCVSVCE